MQASVNGSADAGLWTLWGQTNARPIASQRQGSIRRALAPYQAVMGLAATLADPPLVCTVPRRPPAHAPSSE